MAPHVHPPAYTLPTSVTLAREVGAAADAARAADARVGRVMAVAIAAAVRDILTGNQPGAGFDAAELEIVQNPDGALCPTGRYWTQAGEERSLLRDSDGTGDPLHGLTEWTLWLDYRNEVTWLPLVTEKRDRGGLLTCRLDLAQAAGQPLI
jgi:hypothetical protein